ncbi:pyruvate,orthophosphate dikinase [Clostridium tetanomorphum]|uniref:Pyruvate, phosphate dikinase n=1 Tax=Clostridium tetanomorphum TaxID=1553 RepID=A0A923EBK1_CLOTT|nr:pyruvate, phosphate dikinase [Clostridium tetanomorphum]KAJ53871.1 pyruvate phosphate dikinase [Clostridium tetanomorphum DSM 665]MBC2397385.1 pyruvate, phosphate dikinase [Clostridium tetanomorphum]MBP1862605.1 pyruvate,orthophosphate dikinase [Clostridium tetanomorphum]NRS85554.1 pyruvate,orthophosphate dikinase [Clostridium tetanomorphum]NRZ96435.1 pyruvate,orthophosphate dikinase [Clostridium tetanomorphum]
MEKSKYVYLFKEGNASMKNLLGGKGANLAEMTNLGIPVPQGFTVTTEACSKYYKDGKRLSEEVIEQIYEALQEIENINGKQFGNLENPLLVSVRSGARVSMPGMMDTILNLGLNDETVVALSKLTNNERFAYDSYRRFIQMFSDVVMGIDKRQFEDVLDEVKESIGAKFDTDLKASDLKEIVKKFKNIYKKEMGEEFPQNPKVQLIEAVNAVFRSWDNPRAIVYRRLNDIPGDWGTAVNVQSMVFGNMGETSGTGVAFTRNPATGESEIFGEYLINAQGEDVVAGIRTPQPITRLKEDLPDCYEQFIKIANNLEKHYKDMQDMEFTIEQGKLYFLQTRNGKRTAQAALKIAVDMVNEGLITKEEAILKVDPKQLDALLHPNFDEVELKNAKVIAKGLPASPGAACGKVYFSAEEAKSHHELGEKVILVRLETSPEDIEGMVAAEGILTVRGGMTSHAAVVARGMGTCCVAGCGDIKVNENNKTFEVNGEVYAEGDYISLDGGSGYVYGQAIKTVDPEISGYFGTFMSWADEIRTLNVRTNADTPRDAQQAVKFGAEGIGLCRTEHMFFDEDRIPAVREMIVAETEDQRRKALEKLLPMQKKDFIGIYEAMEERPVTIRFLDPPLHEFLPTEDEDIAELARDMGITFENLKATVESLHEFNPMMGHRGCRLTVSYPEIAEMQTRAVIEAAIDVKKRKGYNIVPEIMIPLIGEIKELRFVKDIVVSVADEIISRLGVDLKYKVGTMIEIPRAAITADDIAKEAEFFSFGTNDLTQMTFGFSRDDAGKFLNDYYDKKIYDFDPFQKLDQNGVGKLINIACDLGRKTRPDIKLGICGEHGGDPASVEFFHNTGLSYVSCSPFRVPVARLAAAQAQVKNPRK